MSLGYSIYIKMQSVNDMVAEKTRALQRQLFHALVLQVTFETFKMRKFYDLDNCSNHLYVHSNNDPILMPYNWC